MLIFIWKILIFLVILPLWGTPEEMLQEAQTSYQQGEKAATYEERKLAFNRALFLYHTLEQEMGSRVIGLNQALADTYFQLGEYAWAILYYQREMKRNSPNALLLLHLEKAQEKLGLPLSLTAHQKENIFLTLSQNFRLLFWTLLIAFLVSSSAIWLSFTWIRKLAFACGLILLFLLGNFLFFYYFTPLEGILVKTTGFYRAPDWNQPQLTNQPLLAGSKVQILQMTKDGEWLKTVNPTGMIGYIPTANVRSI